VENGEKEKRECVKERERCRELSAPRPGRKILNNGERERRGRERGRESGVISSRLEMERNIQQKIYTKQKTKQKQKG
jgi:hypothetical protein